jgi:hypothetical protein
MIIIQTDWGRNLGELHLARMLRDAGGIPAHGNQRAGWEAGCRFDYDNPDYRQGGTGTAMTTDGACRHRAEHHG